MAIPMSALRRALAEMAEGAGYGASQAYRGDHIMGGAALGAFGGGAAGGVADEMTPGEETAYGPAGVFTGAALGALGGGGAKGLRMIYRGIEEGARGGQRGLREALAEAAAERGLGRTASRETANADDAVRFADASAGQFRAGPLREFSNDELRALGQGPTARRGSGGHRLDGGRGRNASDA